MSYIICNNGKLSKRKLKFCKLLLPEVLKSIDEIFGNKKFPEALALGIIYDFLVDKPMSKWWDDKNDVYMFEDTNKTCILHISKNMTIVRWRYYLHLIAYKIWLFDNKGRLKCYHERYPSGDHLYLHFFADGKLHIYDKVICEDDEDTCTTKSITWYKNGCFELSIKTE